MDIKLLSILKESEEEGTNIRSVVVLHKSPVIKIPVQVTLSHGSVLAR